MTKLGYRTTAIEALQGQDLTGKVAIVTGGNSGIGVETVRALAYGGAKVVLCSRSIENGEQAVQLIKGKGAGKGEIEVFQLDLADFDSVRSFALKFLASYDRLDYLILNAGIMACPFRRTKQGFESQFGTNHMGHFLLTQQLLPLLLKQDIPSRVVAVASQAHMFGAPDIDDLNFEKKKYSPWGAYGAAKTSNILFASEFSRRYKDSKIEAFSLHPGGIATNLQKDVNFVLNFIFKYVTGFLWKTTEQGASTTIVAATSPELTGKGGAYLSDCQITSTSKAAADPELARKLWEASEKLVENPPLHLLQS